MEHNSSDKSVDRLNGRTRLRNALLSRSFPDGVLVIPWKEWTAARGGGQVKQCLRQALAQLLQQQVSAVLDVVDDAKEDRGTGINSAQMPSARF
jgi:hypothetical protein